MKSMTKAIVSRTRVLRVAAFAALTLGAVAASAPGLAYAGNEFIGTKENGMITGKGLTNQVFVTSAGNVTCLKTTVMGFFKGIKAKENEYTAKAHVEMLTYAECTGFGENVTVSPSEREYNAAGSVKLLNTVTIETMAKTCHVTIAPAGNEKLEAVSYANLALKIEHKDALKNISYEPSGGVCGAKKAEVNGEYTGSSEAALAEGILEWAPPPPPAPRLEQVDFANNASVLVDHRKEVSHERLAKKEEEPERALAITEFNGADEIEWKSPKAGEVTKNWPVAYVQGTKPKLTARFALEAGTREFLEKEIEGEPTVTGETTVAGVALVFTKKFTIAEIEAQLAAHAKFLETGEIESANALANKIRYERSTITWKWAVKVKGRPRLLEQGLGASVHNVYVTFAKALEGTTIYLTFLDLDSQGIEKQAQPPKEAEAVAGVWEGFASKGGIPSLHTRIYNPATGEIRRTGTILWYYYDIAAGKTLKQHLEAEEEEIRGCAFFTVKALLENVQGRCGAWAYTLQNALATEGLGSELIHLFAQFGEKIPCAEANSCVMLVKHWTFGELGEPEGVFPYLTTQVTDANGVAGQGVENPPPFFWDHAIVKAGPAGSSALYDPSYGTGPFLGKEGLKEGEKPSETSVLTEYQANSIDGFCRPEKEKESKPWKCQKAPAALELKPTAGFEFP